MIPLHRIYHWGPWPPNRRRRRSGEEEEEELEGQVVDV